MSGGLPPGFRFHPTDRELVGYYLKRKVDGFQFELEVIPVIDLYKFDPWELPEKSFLPRRDMEWFFFCPRDRKYPNGSRTNRATKSGYWKATGKDKGVFCQSSVSGYRKTLVFYRGRAPLGDRTDWVMHEYRLCVDNSQVPPNFQGAFALCRIIKRNEPPRKSSDIRLHSTDSTASIDNLMSIPVDISESSYLCNENQRSGSFSSRSNATILPEYEPTLINTETAWQQISPDLILDSSREYSQAQETVPEHISQYQLPVSLVSWQSDQNCETSPSPSPSNFTGETEYAEDLSRFGCMSPYSTDPYYMGYYGNEHNILYEDYNYSSTLQYPES